jgi:ribonucleoside-diphosphate reductase alpha chain
MPHYSYQYVVEKLNKDIEKYFPNIVQPVKPEYNMELDGVNRLVMLDRYSFKDTKKVSLTVGDFVILTVKEDEKWPTRGFGYVKAIEGHDVYVQVESQFIDNLENEVDRATGVVVRDIVSIDKPLELYYEQIAYRVARGLASVEEERVRDKTQKMFYDELMEMNFIPAGRVLNGAGSGEEVTYFNCYVMPFPKDSRGGIAEHRKTVKEIMSRGGGVGTNGSTLRPKHALARGVNGKSSGSVSWLDDLSKLTNLVEQGGSRRGAQMIMLNDWHPDILEFIISKMQNAKILNFIIKTTKDKQIKKLAKAKLKFIPFTKDEKDNLDAAAKYWSLLETPEADSRVTSIIRQLSTGGRYEVNKPDFLEGANISVCITKEFMHAVENDLDYELRFPHVEILDKEGMKFYNEKWHEIGDVRAWEAQGYPVKIYRKVRAKELWNLINICSTYSAEPGIFFIDNANDKTNAKAYGQQVVATNPCGEQPLAPFSVCNLAAVNLAKMVDENGQVNWFKLRRTVRVGVRMQDNVISATPYFLEENTKQALGERRVGLGVMGLHDMLLLAGVAYGSKEGNKLVDKTFETIATVAYSASIELAKEKGSFPFLTDREAFINTGYMKNMPQRIREDILEHGIRNSHLLTVAPTGSTGTLVGVSTGLEPYFSFSYFRSGRLGKFIPVVADIALAWLEKNGYEGTVENLDKLPSHYVTAMQLTPEQHVDVQCTIQRWVDSSLSKTVNAPKGYTVEQVEKVYERLFRGGAKGGTVYVDGSRDAQVLSLTAEENTEKAEVIVEVKPEIQPDKKKGIEIGDTCIICEIGTVVESGGCHTCDNCGAQLACGL